MNVLMEKIMLMEDYLNSSNHADNDKLKAIIKDIKLEADALQVRSAEETDQFKKQVEFYLSALNSLPNPIFVKNEKAEFVFFNTAYKQFFKIKGDTYIGETVFALDYLPLKERKKYHQEDLTLIETGTVLSYKSNFANDDGTEKNTLYWSSGFKSENSLKGLVGEIVDISVEKELQDNLQKALEEFEIVNQQLERAKKHDYLTNLHNRHELEPFLEYIIQMRKNQHFPVCVLLADLDHFKNTNDNFGHLFGDKMLVEFAKILKQSCSESDAVIRYGGEEFLVILPCRDLKTTMEIGERIRAVCEATLILPDNSRMTVSLGGSEFFSNEDFKACLKRADDALYEAKESGRNTVIIK